MYLSRFEYIKALIRYALSAKYRAFIRKQRLFHALLSDIQNVRRHAYLLAESFPEHDGEWHYRTYDYENRVCEWWGKQYE